MNIHNAGFLTSAAKNTGYPSSQMPEVAFAGRSNVGKSSFINKMLNRKNFARVSSSPGKTALINFFNIDNELMLVDLPGYGYAKVSKTEKQRWGNMIEEYLSMRPQLRQAILLVDSRHKPTADDVLMLNWIRQAADKAIVVATKIDKLRKKEREDNLILIKNTLSFTDNDILLPFSSETGEGVKEAWQALCELCNIAEVKGVEGW